MSERQRTNREAVIMPLAPYRAFSIGGGGMSERQRTNREAVIMQLAPYRASSMGAAA